MKIITIKKSLMLLLIGTSLISCSKSSIVPTEETLIGDWQVETIQEKSVIAKTNVNLTFNQAFQVSGAASCNNISSHYTQQNNSLTIGPVITTRKMCNPTVMEQESKMLTTLTKVRRFQLNNGQLTLLDQTGSVQIQAVRTN